MTARPGTLDYYANPAELPRGTLVRLFFEAVDRHDRPDALGYKSGGAWRWISHRALEADVRALALALEALGLERGDRAAILSENRPEWVMADYACLCAGVVDVPIYATLPAVQVAPLLRDSGARAVFVSTAEQLAKVREVAAELPALEVVVVFADVPPEEGRPRVLPLRRLLELGRAEEVARGSAAFRERALAAEPDDLATIIYTSGTTGEPKGVMLTHNNLYSNVQAVRRIFPVGPGDVTLSLLPLSHVFERLNGYFEFAMGTRIAYAESIEAVPQNLLEVRPTYVPSVPRLYEKIYARVMAAGGVKGPLVRWARGVALRWADAVLAAGGPGPVGGGRGPGGPGPWLSFQHAVADRLVFRTLRARTGGQLRFFVSGGAPLNVEIAKFFYAAGLLILEGYGLTETSPVTNANTPDAFKFGTVGRPVPGTEIRIAEDGEILVRGPQVMKGYYGKPEATRAVIDPEGWFHTGDVGELDADGFLRITDRKKDILVTAGGKNIAPQPIESRVKASRFVAEAVMLGDRRPYPVLLVVPNFEVLAAWAAGERIVAADRAALVRDERVRRKVEEEVYAQLGGLARFELPKKIALLPEEFRLDRGEVTPKLSVRRRVVEDRYRDVIESLYAEPSAAGVAGR